MLDISVSTLKVVHSDLLMINGGRRAIQHNI